MVFVNNILVVLGKFMKCFYPGLLFLIPFYFIVFRRWPRRPAVRLLLILALFSLAMRFLLVFANVPLESRYFCPLVVILLIAAAPALWRLIKDANWLCEKASPKLKILSSLKPELIILVIFLTVFGICVGKSLSPRLDKPWIRDIPKEIIANLSKDGKPVLITQLYEIRLAYYSNAEFYRFADMKNYLKKAEFSLSDKGEGSSETVEIKFKKPYVKRSGVLYLDWPSNTNKIQISGSFLNNGTLEWRTLYQGDYKPNIHLSRTTGMRDLRIELEQAPKNLADQFRNVELYRHEKWRILRLGKGSNYGKKFLLSLPGGLENLGGNAAKLGGENVFLVLAGDKDNLDQKYKKLNIPCPFKAIKTFKIRKKGPFTLYQGKPAAEINKLGDEADKR